jgi:FHA domain
MAGSQSMLIRDWQNNLVEFARHHRYTLRTIPIIRLHADSSLRPGAVRIDVGMGAEQNGGEMHTQALSAEQLEQLKAQLQPGQQLPGLAGGASPSQALIGSIPSGSLYNAPGSSNPNQPPVPVQIPPARLTIRLPQSGQQVYRIEKSIINIGRQLSNDIIVEDKRVSRYHAQIKYQPDGNFVIFDLGSTNGITINNTPHMRQHVLRNGDHFTIGSYDFYFERR